MSPDQMKRVAQIAADNMLDAYAAILIALADPILQQKNEYICKCGLRVTPHRCRETGEEF